MTKPQGVSRRWDLGLGHWTLGISIGPPFAPGAEEPEKDYAGNRAGAVDADVAQAAFAGRDEGLMEFVGGGVEDGDPEGFGGDGPLPGE